MDKVTLMVFQKDCMGCHACEVACKQEHGLGVGPRFIKVMERAPSFIPIYCHHCARPPCGEACPVEAISRNEWGIVRVDPEVCIGCQACIEACPFGAMQSDGEREVALMCDLCYERLKNDEAPACSLACPTRCILWGDMQTISREIALRVL
jgi:Fe-S-cluster-containing dehydrogenase component